MSNKTAPNFNPTSPHDLAKNPWALRLALGAAIGLLAAAVIRMFTPPQELTVAPTTTITTTNMDGSQSSFSGITFTGSAQNLPTSLPLITVQTQNTLQAEYENRFIQKFNLEPLPDIEGAWVGEEYYLEKDLVENQYILSHLEPPGASRHITYEQAVPVATAFITDLLPEVRVQPFFPHVDYFLKHQELEEVPAAQAEIIEIPFTYQVNDIPLFLERKADFPFKVMIDPQLKVQKFAFQPFFITNASSTPITLISPNEAVQNILANQAAIITTTQEELGEVSLNTITSGTLTTVSLEYRVDQAQGLAYPFYRFSGTLVNDRGIQLESEVITPAVKTTAASPPPTQP